MAFKVTELELDGVLLIEPQVFSDDRGFFIETYNKDRYSQAGLDITFTQDNHSNSNKGVIRGLHYQLKRPQGKLVSAVKGVIFDVAVDIRLGSPTFGKWVGAILTEENHHQLYVPEGFAHGFSVLSEYADVCYKCTDIFVPGDAFGVLYSDKEIGINWHYDGECYLSDKDKVCPTLADMPKENLPVYKA